MKRNLFQRVLCMVICAAMILAYLPGGLLRAQAAGGDVTTVADPETLTRPGTIYGDSTLNAGKITVGKSVSNGAITVNGQEIGLMGENNFLVTISQSAQVMGLASQTSVPVDVVFVLDTSGSMADNDRAGKLVTAANAAISTLLAANDQNRIAVVAFSSSGEYGGGTSEGNAANVLSSLSHYDGAGETSHLQWVDAYGTPDSRGSYIAGRDAATVTYTERQMVNGRWQQVQVTKNVSAYRNSVNGGTNIQAGIALGASLLTAVTDTTYTDPESGETLNRIPFLIVISDGQPTFVSSDSDWYDPQGDGQMGSGNSSYEGNGFVAALTAAYYKGKITEHYYGDKANGENHCFVYTMGVEIGELSGDDEALAQITLDPSTYTVGDYAAENATSYYRYGNSWDNNRNLSTTHSFKTYWDNFLKGSDFTVRVSSNEYYEVTADSIAAAQKYVSGIGYTGGLQYNDAYYAADNVSQMNTVFASLVEAISKKAITSPTKVSTGDNNFDGYVNFYDPIGEYMEVKDMKGVLAGGYFYQGQSFAQKMANYGTAQADEEFDALLRSVLKARMGLTSADDRFASEAELDAFVHELLTAARVSGNQAGYTDAEHYDNSLVWWGNAYDSGEEDEHVQLIGFADNDAVDYITDGNTVIPEGADYVCRSYFFYGAAGGANPTPDNEFMYFVVRVQRELVAPYRQTVVISAPASLLSVEKVMITETTDENGRMVYTANVEHQEPARVVYEVGLWDTITSENVSLIVSADYAGEQVNGEGSVNYDLVSGVYNFFTNDWDRSASMESHHRGMAKATFDAAADNGFYTYQNDTLLLDAQGDPVSGDPRGTAVYYAREYYTWSDGGEDGSYTATKTSALIRVDIPADAVLVQKDGRWFIPKGTYTSATLVVNGDDTMKDDPATETAADGNRTGTSSIVAHPHRTGDASNSHYTVLLGNNGKLTLVSRPYEPEKRVSLTGADGTVVTDANGHGVQVGDVLTYTIEAKNVLTTAADIIITDYVPNGTAFVAGSAAVDGVADEAMVPDSNNVLTWSLQDVPAGESRTVSFRVTVLPSALNTNVVAGTIQNTAKVSIGNTPAISTNPVYNPPYGKTVSDANGVDQEGQSGKVGDILVFHIRVTNAAMDRDGTFVAADVTVTDTIPAGTVYVEGSADNGGVYADGKLTWTFENMAPGAAKVVSFQVRITADAKADEGTQPEDGQVELTNTAYIQVGNDPVITTNTTANYVALGDMVISKTVAEGGDKTKTFTIRLHETTDLLDGTYVLYRGQSKETVTFAKGKASVTIRHGDVLTIKGLPAGAIISVEEDVSGMPGWTPSYNTRSVTITDGAATTVSSVSVTNTYTLQPLTLTLKGVKHMTGAALTEPITFGFLAMPDAGNPELGDPLSGEVTVSGNGEFTFTMSPKTFTKAGVYTYTITEINGGIPGVNYDGTKHVLQINVLDNGDGTMRAEATLNGQAFDMAGGAVSFSNSYVPEAATLVFAADKALTGRDPVAGEFTFRLTDGVNVYEGINDAEGNILFQAIRFTKAGTYTYTLSEVIPTPGGAGMTYDTATYTLTVVVSDQGGRLVTAVSLDGQSLNVSNGVVDTGVLFINKFVPADASMQITAQKTLLVYDAVSGDHVATRPEAGAFRFRITDEAGNTLAIGTNDASGNVVFDTIYLSAELLADVAPDGAGNRSKTFVYTISEIVPDLAKDPNMKYDTLGREISVLLTHTADGKLLVSVNGDSDGVVDLTQAANFINYGNPASVSVTPVGYKTTVGENLPAGLSFSFAVVPVGGNEDAAIGTSDATQGGSSETAHITFGTMTFGRELLGDKTSRSFDYWIMESNAGAGANGVTYDTTRYLYRVTLSVDVDTGLLTAKEEYFALAEGGDRENAADYTVAVDGAQVSFTNTYAAKAHINLTADKNFSGRPEALKAGEFDFLMQRLDAAGRIVAGSHITGTNDANGVIHFATLNYSNEMLSDAYKHSDGAYYFSYLMTEIKPADLALPGVTYDETKYVVTVKVTQEGENGLTATLAGVSKAAVNGDRYAPGEAVAGFTADGDTNVTFTNVYEALEGDVVRFRIRKVLEGRQIRAGEFEFGLYLNGQLVDVATNDENGDILFSREIPASAAEYAGVYKMTVRELAGSVAGVTYSDQEFTVYVKVEDNGKGQIVATVHLTEDGPALEEGADGTVDLSAQFAFINTYEAHDTTYTPVAGKTLTGRDQVAGEFSFQAQLIHDGDVVVNGPVYRGINDAQGGILFQTVTFTDAGTYLYKISEVKGNAEAVRYDTSVYYLKVVVTDDGNGHLKAAAAYYSDENCTESVAAVNFTNAYTPASVPVTLEGTKTLAGRPMADQEFSFLVYKQGDPVNPVASGNNDAQGNIRFSTFHITAEDMMDAQGEFVAKRTFTYIIKESNNNHPGVTYAQPVTVTVTVTNRNGVFTAEVHYPQGEKAAFHNVYTPGAVSVPLVAYKTLQGKNMQTFTFELKAPDGTVTELTNDSNGVIAMEALQFTAEDLVDAAGNKVMEKTFVYTLREKAGTMDGMVYDGTEYTITVTVTDDGKGHLAAEVVYTVQGKAVEVLQFVNTYTPPAMELELEGLKSIVDSEGQPLTGENFPLSGFEFLVYDADGNLISEATSQSDGKIRFTGFRFQAAGDYRFTVLEKTTAKAGYSTDATVWCVHISVGYDAQEGRLYKSGEYIHVAPESHDDVVGHSQEQLVFVNVYEPANVSLLISGMKVLEGRPLREHEFTFYMVDDATGLRAAESRNHGNGKINFSLHYSKAGTYTYTVYEEIPEDPAQHFGVTYTTKTHRITVEVTDDGTGALKARVNDITVLGRGVVDLTESLIFTNIYSPESAGVTVEAHKYLEGKTLEEGKYTFRLTNGDNAEEVYTATNLADGRIAFETLVFEAADLLDETGEKLMEKTFTYYLSEVKGDEAGVTYDEQVYTVRITVTDDGYGQLHTQVTYENAQGETVALPEFRNVYRAAAVTYTPEVHKIYEGGDMLNFDFVLAGEGFETQIKQNDGDGRVLFDTLTFTQAGTYTFTISEQANEDLEDIKWDTNVYTLVFLVTDPGDGQLVISDITITSDLGRADLIFRNVHEDLVTRKDVFVAGKEEISIDGQTVQKGDVLTYEIRYRNYTGKAVDVTISDTIPAYTAYVEGSAGEGAVLTDNVLTWTFANVEPDGVITVSFQVTVVGTNVTVTNEALVLEGENTYTTNTVTTMVPEDEFTKDAALESDPTVSIDNTIVQKGDVLIYTITYANSYEAAADVTIMDTIPQFTVYVEGSADHGGVFENGVLTWNVHLEAGESIAVSFRVRVDSRNAIITNQATALEGENSYSTNTVTVTTPADNPKTGDDFGMVALLTMMGISALGIVLMLAVVPMSRKKAEK